MLGFGFTLEVKGFGTLDFWGTWSEWHEGCKWTVDEQSGYFADAVRRVKSLLYDAGVQHLHELKGKPIEITNDGNKMISWRILKEVL